MDKPVEQLQQQVNQYLDQQNADMTVLRVTLQVLIWNIVRHDAQGANILKLLKDEVMASIYRTTTAPAGAPVPPNLERLRQLTLLRADKMFQDIEQALGGTPPRPGASSH